MKTDIRDILLRTKLFIAEQRSMLFSSHACPKDGAIDEPEVQDDLSEMADLCSDLDEVAFAFECIQAAKENAVQQAQVWAMEARTQQATVAEIYKAIGFDGGDWNGARPVVETVQGLCGQVRLLRRLLNPRNWTKAQSDAWHQALPDTQKAFAALLATLDNSKQEG